MRKRKLNALLAEIATAQDSELNQIISQITYRYGSLYPDWEIMFLSLPKDSAEERNRILASMVNLLSYPPK